MNRLYENIHFHMIFLDGVYLSAGDSSPGAPKAPVCPGEQDQPPTPRHVAMNWARRLKRVFAVEVEACARYGGKLKIIASIE